MNKNLEKDYKILSEDFQKKLIEVCFLVTMMNFLIEIIYFPMCLFAGMIQISLMEYILIFIVRPSITNIVLYSISKYIYKKCKNEETKKIIPIVLLVIICANIIVSHSVFGALYTIYVIPILLTVVYGNLKITRKTLFITLCFATIGYLIIPFDKYTTMPDNYLFNIILSYILILCSYIIAKYIIGYIDRKEKILKDSFIQNTQLKEELEHDGLTNLYNHSAFMEMLRTLTKESKDVNMAILDIDFFKKVNDTYGHEAGNVVLKSFAELLKSYESQKIKPARYGGEEFAILFDGFSNDDVYNIVEKMRKDLAEIKFKELKNNNVTFSAGIAKYSTDLDITNFIEKADFALYKSKKNGRNQTTMS